MNVLKTLKDSLPALLQVFEKILQELEEINESNNKILKAIEKNEGKNICCNPEGKSNGDKGT